MADPRSFISFDFDHNENDKTLFVGQSKNSKTPFTIYHTRLVSKSIYATISMGSYRQRKNKQNK